MTADELVDFLQKMPPKTPVVRWSSYGDTMFVSGADLVTVDSCCWRKYEARQLREQGIKEVVVIR